MAGARYCQVVVSASRKLKHEDAHVRKGLVLNGDLTCQVRFFFLKKKV